MKQPTQAASQPASRSGSLSGSNYRSVRMGPFTAALIFSVALAAATIATDSAAAGQVLTSTQKAELDKNWKLSLTEDKGPYSLNYCVCKDDKKKPGKK